MPTIDLSADKPTSNTMGDANAFRNAFTALEALLNGGLDDANWAAGKIFDPLQLKQDGATNGQGLVWSAAANSGAGGWVPQTLGVTEELGYAEFTSVVTNGAATTEAAAAVVVTAPSLTFDGSTVVILEFFAPSVDPGGGAGSGVLTLHDGTATMGQFYEVTDRNVAVARRGVYAVRRFTPAAGTRAYSVRCYDTSGASSLGITGGAGGSGNFMPGFIRIKKAA